MERTHFGDRFAEIVAEAFGNQVEAGKFFGTKQGTISKWVSRETFTPRILSKLVTIRELGYNPAYLFEEGAEKKEVDPKGLKREKVKTLTARIRQNVTELIQAKDGEWAREFYTKNINSQLEQIEQIV